MKDPAARAHGYSLAAVRCADEREAAQVRDALGSNDFHGLPGEQQYSKGALGDWFGGRFHSVGCISADAEVSVTMTGCTGDNRNAIAFDAAQVLDAIHAESTLPAVPAR